MKQIINTDRAPKAVGPYSQAILAGNMLFVSGQISIDAATNEVVRGSTNDQFELIMKNIKAILQQANMTLSNVVQVTIYMTDLADFSVVNNAYSKYFDGDYPSRVTVEVSRLPKDVNIEISCIAVLD